LRIIKIEEDKQFLQKQRENGRVGFMIGVDKILTTLEEKRQTKRKNEKTF